MESRFKSIGCTFFCHIRSATEKSLGKKSYRSGCCKYTIISAATICSLSTISFLKKITLGKLLLMCFIQNGSSLMKWIISFPSLPHPSHFLTQCYWIYSAIDSFVMVWLRENVSSKSSTFLFLIKKQTLYTSNLQTRKSQHSIPGFYCTYYSTPKPFNLTGKIFTPRA